MSETRQAEQATLFAVTAQPEGADSRLVLRGEFDLVGLGAARAVLDDTLREQPETILIDLSELTFMDSTGLRFLLCAQRRCAEDGCSLVVRLGGPAIRRVFTLTRMDTVFDFDG